MSLPNPEHHLEALTMPSLNASAQELALLASNDEECFVNQADSFFKQNKAVDRIGINLQAISPWIEPVDRILGVDPKQRRAQGFKQGVYVGLWMSTELYIGNETAVRAMGRYVISLFHDLENIKVPNDHAQTIELRGRALHDLGWRGVKIFGDLSEELDAIAETIQPDIRSRSTFSVGCGVTLLAVAEGFYAREMEALSCMADSMEAGDHDIDAELKSLLD